MTDQEQVRRLDVAMDDVAAPDPAESILASVELGEPPPDDIQRVPDASWYESELRGPNARECYARMLENYAAQIRSGVLDGVRAQWREGLHHAACVELEARPVQLPDGSRVRRIALRRYDFMTPERPDDYDEATEPTGE